MEFKTEGKKWDRKKGEKPPREKDLENVMEIDGGILEYVRERMHCKKVTREVIRQTVLFQKEMDRMQGW